MPSSASPKRKPTPTYVQTGMPRDFLAFTARTGDVRSSIAAMRAGLTLGPLGRALLRRPRARRLGRLLVHLLDADLLGGLGVDHLLLLRDLGRWHAEDGLGGAAAARALGHA